MPSVEKVIETHMAFVFLTRSEALKMKKPVRFGRFDHRTLRARHRACLEELRVNQPLAPGVYRGLVPLARSPRGMALGGPGRPIEWLVRMRRLPADRMLDVVIAEGRGPTEAALGELAERLAAFYRDPGHPRPVSGQWLARVRSDVALSAERLNFFGKHLPPQRAADLARRWFDLIRSCLDEIADREDRRLVVDGHGDLRPEHVCLESPPVVFDRIEFSDEMRIVDTFEEIGFLGLECARLGRSDLGPDLARMMTRLGFKPPSTELATAHLVHDCLSRARLCLEHLTDAKPRNPEVWPVRARDYLDRAEAALAGLGLPPDPGPGTEITGTKRVRSRAPGQPPGPRGRRVGDRLPESRSKPGPRAG